MAMFPDRMADRQDRLVWSDTGADHLTELFSARCDRSSGDGNPYGMWSHPMERRGV
ncbi:MAG: hypothetical protein V1800_18090 [Candidatus Latescibacterota bacterium]